MTSDEREVVDHLVAAWNKFLTLPVEHPDDVHEFRLSVHRLQEKILARASRRMVNEQAADPGYSSCTVQKYMGPLGGSMG